MSVPVAGFVPKARDMEILYGYASGLTDAEIAKVIDVHVAYAMTLGYRMRLRMGARNRAHAVAIAFRLGVLTVDEGAS